MSDRPRLKSPVKPKRISRLRRIFGSKAKKKSKSREPRDVTRSLGWQFDRMLSVAFPIAAAKRMQSRYQQHMALQRIDMLEQRGFDGARNDEYRKDRWTSLRNDIDGYLDDDITDLQNRCEELVRNNNVAKSAVEGRVTNEIGVGILCQPMVKRTPGVVTEQQSERINDGLKDFIDRWSQYGVDQSRQFTLPQFQKQVCRQLGTFGECFVLFGDTRYFGPSSFAMEVIHPARVESPPKYANDPNVRLGVRYDDSNCVIGYYVRTRHPDDSKKFEIKYEYYERFDPKTGRVRMCHIFDPMFPGQSRGIPWLATAMNRCKDLDDYWEAELINKQVEACFGLAITGGTNQSTSPYDEAQRNADETKSDGTRITELNPGAVNYFPEGADVKTVDPQRPGATFAPFIEWSLRSIAASLNYPYELLAKNFFRTTYSSGRLAMLDGRMGFRMRTQMLIDMWLVHVHRRLVYEAMMTGFVEIDILAYRAKKWVFERHNWRGQNRGLLDPEKENKGHKVGLEAEIESRSGIAINRGETLDDIEMELTMEGKRRAEREVAIARYRRDLEIAAGLEPGSSIPDAMPTGSADDDDDTDPDTDDEMEGQRAASAA